MNARLLPRLLPQLAAVALGCAMLAGHADTSPAAASSPAATHKPVVRKPVKAKPKAEPAAPALPDATPEQLDAAKMVYIGKYECEFKETVDVEANAKHNGYIDVHWRKNTYTMKPVLSSTRAIRLEDVTGKTLVVQIANKSMLLDVKLGQRLVDDCESSEQQATTARMAAAAASGAAGDGFSLISPAAASAASAALAKP
ncbi:MAG: hypothetical protein JO369_00635 [Paucibacter sp.]|nr:hypothetical protein [Roseateles sp.]